MSAWVLQLSQTVVHFSPKVVSKVFPAMNQWAHLINDLDFLRFILTQDNILFVCLFVCFAPSKLQTSG